MSEKEVLFRLSRHDAGQIIDGLSVCLGNWQKTLNWYDGKLENPDFFILECSGRDEAANMVEIYEDLLESLGQQMKACRTSCNKSP